MWRSVRDTIGYPLMENLAALLEMTVMEQLEKCCLHSVGAHDAVGPVEGMDVMSAMAQALPLHKL